MRRKARRLTISLSQELAQVVKEIARERKTSRSKMLSACLEELAKKRLCAQMEEGYKTMANENLECAKTAMNLAHEAMPDWI